MFLKLRMEIAVSSLLIISAGMADAQFKTGWYTEGKNYAPKRRIKITVTNPFAVPVKGTPVVVHRKITSRAVQTAGNAWKSRVS